MNVPLLFAYAGAVAAGALALGTAIRARRVVARWAFVAGMAILAAESAGQGLFAKAVTPERMIRGSSGV